MFGLKLPNSKIGVQVATWKSVLDIEENPANRGRGVMPDYPEGSQIIGGVDTRGQSRQGHQAQQQHITPGVAQASGHCRRETGRNSTGTLPIGR
jgi:hypothetical protein